jgi:phosphoglycerate dehydrogenase-like enzyme
MKIAILDDYQGVALNYADWSTVQTTCAVSVFRHNISDERELIRELQPFDIVVAMRERTPFPSSILTELPQLKLLVTTGSRNRSVDIRAAEARGVLVCGTDSPAGGTVELTWGLILALARSIHTHDVALRSGQWQLYLGSEMKGKTLGVLGLGRIGSTVAAIGKAFGMSVIAWSQNLDTDTAKKHGVDLVTKDVLFQSADVVTIHLLLSDRTRGLVGEPELMMMRSTAYLINTSRGPIVDENILLRALQQGWIAGAAVDVFDQEPLAVDHPFRKLDNILLSPHMGYVTKEAYEIFYPQVVEDIEAFLKGIPIRILSEAS